MFGLGAYINHEYVQNSNENIVSKIAMEECMKKIRIIKMCFVLIFVICSIVYVQAQIRDYTVESSMKRIDELVNTIEENLSGTTVLEKFKEDQQAWVYYKKIHMELLFPESINNVDMLWGSILSHEMGLEEIKLNKSRITVLEDYLNRDGEAESFKIVVA